MIVFKEKVLHVDLKITKSRVVQTPGRKRVVAALPLMRV
jgi:hypothetical protein